MIEELLGRPVVAVEAFDDPPEAVLLPEEEPVVARAVDKRRREFTTARWCARAALAELGIAPVPILPGERGAPGWPPGVVGSMTHCVGYRAAAVARTGQVATIGLDAEPNEPLPDGVLDLVTLPAERQWITALTARHPQVCWDRLVFSVKESVYKAWFPLTRRWLGFEEAQVTVAPQAGTFTVRLLGDAAVTVPGFTGGWLARAGLLVTAIAVPAVENLTPSP